MIVLKLISRELLNNKKKWVFFCFNLIVGLVGFTTIYLFSENVTSTLDQRAKYLLSSDIAITGRVDLSEKSKEDVKTYFEDKKSDYTKLVELYSMAVSNQDGQKISRLIFVKSIENKFPLIGNISLESGEDLTPAKISDLEKEPSVYISEEVKHQFKLKIGSKLKIGVLNFIVKGIIKEDTTSAMRGIGFAPKVYISLFQLKRAELLKEGSVAWYSYFYNLKENQNNEDIINELKTIVLDPAIKIKGPKSSGQQVSRVLNYLTDYLGLIAIVALFISIIGASFLFQTYIYERLKQIGILKSLGLSSVNIYKLYLGLIVIIGTITSIITIGIVSLFLPFLLDIMKTFFVGNFELDLSLNLCIMILSISIIMNIFICLPILAKVIRSTTSELLDYKISDKNSRKDIVFYLPMIFFLWMLSVWQSHSFIIGSFFIGTLAVIFGLILFVFPKVFSFFETKLLNKKLSYPLSLSFGTATRSILRNKISTILTIISLVVGISLMVMIGQLNKSITNQLIGDNSFTPSLFLFDIQDEQASSLIEFAKKENIPLSKPTPMVRARLIKKNGEEVKRLESNDGFKTREDENEERFNNRGVNLTYNDQLKKSEKMIEGRPFSGSYSGEGLVEASLEKRYAKRLNVGLGDRLTYDILGVEIEVEIISLREVNWTSFEPNFFILLQPGAIEDAPKTFLTSINKITDEEKLIIQDKIVEKFSNISIINVSEIAEKIITLFGIMAKAISSMALCCIFVGLLVLFSIIQNQLNQKSKSLAIQKVLGLNKGDIFKSFFYEYNIIVLISIILGNSFGIIISYLISAILLDGIFELNYSYLLFTNISILVLSNFIIKYTFESYFKVIVRKLLD